MGGNEWTLTGDIEELCSTLRSAFRAQGFVLTSPPKKKAKPFPKHKSLGSTQKRHRSVKQQIHQKLNDLRDSAVGDGEEFKRFSQAVNGLKEEKQRELKERLAKQKANFVEANKVVTKTPLLSSLCEEPLEAVINPLDQTRRFWLPVVANTERLKIWAAALALSREERRKAAQTIMKDTIEVIHETVEQRQDFLQKVANSNAIKAFVRRFRVRYRIKNAVIVRRFLVSCLKLNRVKTACAMMKRTVLSLQRAVRRKRLYTRARLNLLHRQWLQVESSLLGVPWASVLKSLQAVEGEPPDQVPRLTLQDGLPFEERDHFIKLSYFRCRREYIRDLLKYDREVSLYKAETRRALMVANELESKLTEHSSLRPPFKPVKPFFWPLAPQHQLTRLVSSLFEERRRMREKRNDLAPMKRPLSPLVIGGMPLSMVPEGKRSLHQPTPPPELPPHPPAPLEEETVVSKAVPLQTIFHQSPPHPRTHKAEGPPKLKTCVKGGRRQQGGVVEGTLVNVFDAEGAAKKKAEHRRVLASDRQLGVQRERIRSMVDLAAMLKIPTRDALTNFLYHKMPASRWTTEGGGGEHLVQGTPCVKPSVKEIMCAKETVAHPFPPLGPPPTSRPNVLCRVNSLPKDDPTDTPRPFYEIHKCDLTTPVPTAHSRPGRLRNAPPVGKDIEEGTPLQEGGMHTVPGSRSTWSPVTAQSEMSSRAPSVGDSSRKMGRAELGNLIRVALELSKAFPVENE